MDDILKQNIIKDLGIDTLPKDQQEQALLKIGKIIFQGVLIKVLNKLNDEDKDRLDAILIEKPSDQEVVLNFLRSKISDFDEIVNGEVAEFKRESVDLMKGIANK